MGTYLYGRRMYEVTAPWDSDPFLAGGSPAMNEFAATRQAADKIVYSTTLTTPTTGRTRVESSFDLDDVQALKASAQRDLSVSGPTLAAQALSGGLVDEVHVLLAPVTVGAGLHAFPTDTPRNLTLLDHRVFPSHGMGYLRHALTG